MKLPDAVWGVWSVWRRYFSVFVKSIIYYLVSSFVEPLLYLLAFGVGVGSLIGTLQVGGVRLSYRSFIFSGIIAQTALLKEAREKKIRRGATLVARQNFLQRRLGVGGGGFQLHARLEQGAFLVILPDRGGMEQLRRAGGIAGFKILPDQMRANFPITGRGEERFFEKLEGGIIHGQRVFG